MKKKVINKRINKNIIYIIFIISLTYILCSYIIMYDQEELFINAWKLDIILREIFSALLISTIFYYITVTLKEKHERNVIFPHIDKYINRVVSWARRLSSDLFKENHKFPDKNNIEKILKETNPADNSKLLISHLGRNANRLEYLHFCMQRSISWLDKLANKSQYLDIELENILIKIEDSTFFRQKKFFMK